MINLYLVNFDKINQNKKINKSKTTLLNYTNKPMYSHIKYNNDYISFKGTIDQTKLNRARQEKIFQRNKECLKDIIPQETSEIFFNWLRPAFKRNPYVSEKAIDIVRLNLNSNPEVAQLQLEYIDEIYPTTKNLPTSIWFHKNIIGSVSSNPQTAKLELDWLRKNKEMLNNTFMGCDLFGSISNKPEIAQLQLDYLEQAYSQDKKHFSINHFKDVFSAMSTNFSVAKLQLDWMDKQRKDIQNDCQFYHILKAIKPNLSVAEMQFAFLDKFIDEYNAHPATYKTKRGREVALPPVPQILSIAEIVNAVSVHPPKAEKQLVWADKILQQDRSLCGEIPLLLESGMWKYEGCKSISELTNIEKFKLLHSLIDYCKDRYYAFDFIPKKIYTNKEEIKSLKAIFPFFPDSTEKYVKIISLLLNSATDMRVLSPTDKQAFWDNIDSLIDTNNHFAQMDVKDFDDLKVNLTYPREKFRENVIEILRGLTKTQQDTVTKHFDFTLFTNQYGTHLEGSPVIPEHDNLDKISDMELRKKMRLVKNEIQKFTQHNFVSIDDYPELAANLQKIIKLLPQMVAIVGKKRHNTHDYSVDVHTLKTLHSIVNNEDFQALPKSDKRVLFLAGLFHDISKSENLKYEHYCNPKQNLTSAISAYILANKLDLSKTDKEKLFNLVLYHNWPKRYYKSDKKEYKAKLYAYTFRYENMWTMAKILATSDLKSIKKNSAYLHAYQDIYNTATKAISKEHEIFQNTQICLPQTKLPKASELKIDGMNVKKESKDGIDNVVVYLKNIDNLEQYGFKNCQKVEDLSFIVHGLSGEDHFYNVLTSMLPMNDIALSSSYIWRGKTSSVAFEPQGFIFDVSSSNIFTGQPNDLDSGYIKSAKEIIDNRHWLNARSEFSNFIRNELQLSADEYSKFMETIQGKTIEEIGEINPMFKSALKNYLVKKRRYNSGEVDPPWNEYLVTYPKIQGIFFFGKSFSEVPVYFRKYANEHNLPLIMLGDYEPFYRVAIE